MNGFYWERQCVKRKSCGMGANRVNEVPLKAFWNAYLARGLSSHAKPLSCQSHSVLKKTPKRIKHLGSHWSAFFDSVTHKQIWSTITTTQCMTHCLRLGLQVAVQLSLQVQQQNIMRFSHWDTQARECGEWGRRRGWGRSVGVTQKEKRHNDNVWAVCRAPWWWKESSGAFKKKIIMSRYSNTSANMDFHWVLVLYFFCLSVNGRGEESVRGTCRHQVIL